MGDYQQKMSGTLSERMRMIRLRRKKERLRFWKEFGLVPRWLVWLMIFLFVLAQVIAALVNNWAFSHNGDVFLPEFHDTPELSFVALAGMVTLVSLFFGSFVFLLGYVNQDAKRRGMNSALWTLLVLVFVPTWGLIGFVIYLLMREPLPYPCPQCGNNVGPRFNFCPNCKCNLHPTCPNCKHEVGELDRYCPYCAQDLANAPAEAPGATAEALKSDAI
jgi:hypothetical protein